MSLNQQDRDTIEALIDKTNLSSVLDALGEICGDKAGHLLDNWQEKMTSPHVRFWTVWCNRLQKLGRLAEPSERELKTYRGPS